MDRQKHTISFRPPLSTLGELALYVNQFIEQHPNPNDEPRKIAVTTTISGMIKSITIET